MFKAGKRYLFLFHRWLGVALSVVFGLWFASGFVMMYVGYPNLTEEEYFTALPPLALADVRVTSAQALAKANATAPIELLLLTTVLNRPAYRILDGHKHWSTVFADNGEHLNGLSKANAIQVAQHFSPDASIYYDSIIEVDQWTVSSSLNALRPFHKVRVNNASHTELYISDVTGMVARDTTAYERGWNWLGSVIHWIYPLPLRQHGQLWQNLVIYLSLAGTLATMAGMIIGVMRLRLRKRYSRNRVTPYSGMQKLHHVLGMIIGGVVLMFIFSGMMSMNPWGVFDASTSIKTQLNHYQAAALPEDTVAPTTQNLYQHLPATFVPKQVEWRMIGGEQFLILAQSPHQRIAISTNHLSGNTIERAVRKAAPLLVNNADITATEVLSEHDMWYYSHHDSYRPLPVLRVKFNDPEYTWFHIDLTSGNVLNRLTTAGRVERWLYNGMHSLDFPFLINNRPLWDIVVLLLSLVGLIFCVTSVVIGWQRLVGTNRKNRTVRANQPARSHILTV